MTDIIELQKQQRDPDHDNVTRSLPHAVGPEKSVLSQCMQDPQEYLTIAIEEGITEKHFYLPQHAALYEFLIELFQANQEIELVSLVQKLLDAGKLDKCGGPGEVAGLYTYSPSSGYFRSHLQHIKDKHTLRELLRACNSTVAAVYEEPEQPSVLLDEAERSILAIREGTSNREDESNREVLSQIMQELQMRIEGKRPDSAGITTGFTDLDTMTGGLKKGEVFIIAARPSMGKTSLMMNIVEHICLDCGIPTQVFSAEMTKKQLIERLTYARAKFAASQLLRGYRPTKPELEKFRLATTQIDAAPLFIYDKASPTINELRAKARRAKRKHGIGAIAMDYLQLFKSTSKQAQSSREREIAEISAGIKGMAKDLDVPIILLAQLNRGPENRTGKAKGRPQMSDLRESGSIEQDADVIGLLTRPAYHAATEEEKKALAGVAELIIAKNRNGATGLLPLTFIEELMRFETGPPAKEEPEEPAPKENRYSNSKR